MSRVIKAQLAAWIVDVRSVSSDPLAQKAALSAFVRMTAATATLFLNDYYRQHSPFSQTAPLRSASMRCCRSATNLSDPMERGRRDLQGRDLATTHWLASVTVAFDPPTDERGVLSNPLGLYVTGISWTQHL
jgi:type IV secretory pathway TrbF-like protein